MNVLPVLFVRGTVVVPRIHCRGHPWIDRTARRQRRVRESRPARGTVSVISLVDRRPVQHPVHHHRRRAVPERLIRTYLERGITLLQGYGLSKALAIGTAARSARLAARRRSAPQAGRRCWWTCESSRPTDEMRGRERPASCSSAVPNVMAGYWRRPDATRATLTAEGWLCIGDAARIDDDGFVWIVDRVSARFATAGGSVFPGDVERVSWSTPRSPMPQFLVSPLMATWSASRSSSSRPTAPRQRRRSLSSAGCGSRRMRCRSRYRSSTGFPAARLASCNESSCAADALWRHVRMRMVIAPHIPSRPR